MLLPCMCEVTHEAAGLAFTRNMQQRLMQLLAAVYAGLCVCP